MSKRSRLAVAAFAAVLVSTIGFAGPADAKPVVQAGTHYCC